MILRADIFSAQAVRDLKQELETGANAPGEVLVRLILGDDDASMIRLGHNFVLNGDLAERIAQIEGIERVELAPARGRANLKLVA